MLRLRVGKGAELSARYLRNGRQEVVVRNLLMCSAALLNGFYRIACASRNVRDLHPHAKVYE